ncbi:MAG: hypothetical protein ACI9HK_004287, partial [Pirellulaceae bacterium]
AWGHPMARYRLFVKRTQSEPYLIYWFAVAR